MQVHFQPMGTVPFDSLVSREFSFSSPLPPELSGAEIFLNIHLRIQSSHNAQNFKALSLLKCTF
jgi:hypothetical protein